MASCYREIIFFGRFFVLGLSTSNVKPPTPLSMKSFALMRVAFAATFVFSFGIPVASAAGFQNVFLNISSFASTVINSFHTSSAQQQTTITQQSSGGPSNMSATANGTAVNTHTSTISANTQNNIQVNIQN